MRRSLSVTLAAIAATGLAFGVVPTSDGQLVTTPVACEEGDLTPDGRVFPEPMLSATYLTFAEFECGIALLEEQHPDRLEVTTELDEATGSGLPLYNVVMTDEAVPSASKERLLVMSSIHGDEVGPREGAARQIEDLLTGATLGTFDLTAGLDVDRLLAEFELHWVFPNPAGWENGEGVEGGDVTATYTRGNAGGTDLNRNFPVQGFFDYPREGYFQPEGLAMRELLQEGRTAELAGESLGWGLGTDNHGQLTDSYLAAGLQIVGQFDYQKSEELATFADRIDDEMANYFSNSPFAEVQLALQEAGYDVAGGYRWGTLYDILGYSASGSGIDYYNTPGEIEGVGFATEVTAGKQLAANRFTYSGVLNQVWVDSIRAINMAMFKEALAENDGDRDFTFELDGDVAYVLDPARITHDDANGVGANGGYHDGTATGGGPSELRDTPAPADQGPFAAYDVSKYDFFVDLDREANTSVVPVPADEVATADLSGFAAVVLTEAEVLDRLDVRDDALAALRAYAEGGGTVVLTDDALTTLPDLGFDVSADDISVRRAYVGAVQEFVGDSELNSGLRGVASQTYDTVPIGFDFPGEAPNWIIDQEAWEAAGGTTTGLSKNVTFNALGQAQLEEQGSEATIYGEAPLGEGRVRILGALLPDPTEEFYHPFGLQDYAVTYTGYTLLQNMVNVD